MAGMKGPTKVPAPASPTGGFVLGSRPAVLRAPPMGRPPPAIKPQAAGTRNYGKGAAAPAAPFSTLGQGNTGQIQGMS